MSSIIIYYSLNGKTEIAAKGIAEVLKSKSRKIVEIQHRAGLLGFIRSGFDAARGVSSDIRPMDTGLENFNTVFLASPVWAGSSTPAMNAFIDEADFNHKKVVLVATMATKSNLSFIKRMTRRIEKKGGQVIGNLMICIKGLNKDQISEEAKKSAEVYL